MKNINGMYNENRNGGINEICGERKYQWREGVMKRNGERR